MNLRATDPKQYDTPQLNWRVVGAEDSWSRQYFRKVLDTAIPPKSLASKHVIDIGCGVGQLFNWLRGKGAATVTGFDPSEENIKAVRELYPWVEMSKETLNEFAGRNKKSFDVAFAVMIFEHILDLGAGLKNVYDLLSNEGVLYLIIGDKNAHISNDPAARNHDFVRCEVMQEFPDGTVEVKTVRNLEDGGRTVMYDILRPLEVVKDHIVASGFTTLAKKPLFKVSESGEVAKPRVVICHLFILRKN